MMDKESRIALSNEIQAFVKYCEKADADEFNLIMIQTVLRTFAFWLTMSDNARHGESKSEES